MMSEMNQFKAKIKNRHDQNFYEIMTSGMLQRLSDNDQQMLRENFQVTMNEKIPGYEK